MCEGGEDTWHAGHLLLDRLLNVCGTKGRMCLYAPKAIWPFASESSIILGSSYRGKSISHCGFYGAAGNQRLLQILPRLLPRALVYTLLFSRQMTPSPALNTGGFVHLHWRGIAVEGEEGII